MPLPSALPTISDGSGCLGTLADSVLPPCGARSQVDVTQGALVGVRLCSRKCVPSRPRVPADSIAAAWASPPRGHGSGRRRPEEGRGRSERGVCGP